LVDFCTQSHKQSLNKLETNEPHPNSICATPTSIPPNCEFGWLSAWENSYVDEVMCDLQGSNEKAAVERFRALSVRVGVAGPRELKNGCNPAAQGANLH
jgi:hypothetical protein